MERVKLVQMDDYVVITGADLDAVNGAVGELLGQGYTQVEKVQPLGRNWIATCRVVRDARETRIEQTSIGLQTVLECPCLKTLKAHIEEATQYGAVLVEGPEWVEKRWVAVLDAKASAKRRRS